MKDVIYEVVSPEAEPEIKTIPSATPLTDFHGKKIAFVWTPSFKNGDILAKSIASLLKLRFSNLTTIEMPPGKNLLWGAYPEENLTELAKESEVDAAVVLVGG